METKINFSSSNIENIKAGELRAKFSAAGDRILRYYVDFQHTKLDLHKEVSAPEFPILQNKVNTLMAQWDKKFETFQNKQSVTAGKALAEDMTLESETRRESLRNILHHTLTIDDTVDWSVLKDNSKFVTKSFPTPRPKRPKKPKTPELEKVSFIAGLFGKKKQAQLRHEEAEKDYEKTIESQNSAFLKIESNWQADEDEWDVKQQKLKKEFEQQQAESNAKVDGLKSSWETGAPEAIEEHASMVLEASEYDELIPKDFDIQYEAEGKTLLVEYILPSPDDLPLTKKVTFVASTGELKETQIALKDKKSLFEDIGYQICLRTIHELFEADTPEHVDNIVFNGTANYIDRATGQEVCSTILSLMVGREDFLAINLERIDPKTCFKSFRGVSGAVLIGLAPIAPIMKLNKDDRRFIDARNVDLGDDGSTNLAAMDWDDFEHLVRELFDKEFAARGGEVKVTQSSSDGGVDAVAFDPDPISGGKIVIQAKRYTRTVGVSAVRDLYGTTMNEGATKGILVTTADYGPDAYKFASDKPLTLMTGSHLLHLLEKHGVKAKIDLQAARKELGLSN